MKQLIYNRQRKCLEREFVGSATIVTESAFSGILQKNVQTNVLVNYAAKYTLEGKRKRNCFVLCSLSPCKDKSRSYCIDYCDSVIEAERRAHIEK